MTQEEKTEIVEMVIDMFDRINMQSPVGSIFDEIVEFITQHISKVEQEENKGYADFNESDISFGFSLWIESKTKSNQIQEAKDLLKANGYFVDNLWCVADVKGIFKCTDEQAQDVLYRSLTNEATMEQVQFSIRTFAEMDGLDEIEVEE